MGKYIISVLWALIFVQANPQGALAGEQEKPASLRDALMLAIQDEYLARDTYRAAIAAHGEVRPFSRIVEAEERHIAALLEQFDRLGYVPPEDRSKIPEVSGSLQDACRAAVQAESRNVALYEKLIEAAEADPQVVATFRKLQAASRDRHLPAFTRCASGARGPRGPSR